MGNNLDRLDTNIADDIFRGRYDTIAYINSMVTESQNLNLFLLLNGFDGNLFMSSMQTVMTFKLLV